jgi:acyl carrier protein
VEEEIFKKVQETLAGALGRDLSEIRMDASLVRDLGAESIDFIDIIFRLEKVFDIKIPSGELFPAHILSDERFVQSGVVTPEGLDELKNKLPYLDIEVFRRDPKVSRLADFFTVRMIVQYVRGRLTPQSGQS